MAERNHTDTAPPAEDATRPTAVEAAAVEETAKPRRRSKKPKVARVDTAPEPRRAGGYIDRGDGHGWVLDDSPPKPPPVEPQPKPAPTGPSQAGGWVLPRDEE